MISFKTMNTDDKHFLLLSIVVPAIAWWVLVGRKRYGVKGMK